MTHTPQEEKRCCPDCYVADDMCRQYLCACHLKSESPAPLQEIKDPTGWAKKLSDKAFVINPLKFPEFKRKGALVRVKDVEDLIRSLLHSTAEKAREEGRNEACDYIFMNTKHRAIDGGFVIYPQDFRATIEEARKSK